MKTILKITAIMAIAVLIPLSCSPEVELTERDWSENDSKFSAEYTNNPAGLALCPTVDLPLLPWYSANMPPENGDMVFTFPASADFLKVPNDQLLAKLKEFLSVYAFTTPPAIGGESYSLSVKGDTFEIEELVSRVNTVDPDTKEKKVEIKLRFKHPGNFPTGPSTPPALSVGIVAKIEGAKYTFGGVGLDLDNDGVGGEEIYDDYYIDVGPNASGPYKKPSTYFSLKINPLDVNDKVSYSGGGALESYDIAVISGDPFGGTNGTGRRDAVLESLKGKFKIQKFTNGSWADAGAAMSANGNNLRATFTREDLGVYRVYAEGLKGFKTSHGAASVLGAEQKLSLTLDDPLLAGLEFRTDKFASTLTGFYVGANRLYTSDVLGTKTPTVQEPALKVINSSYDNNGKKAVFELQFNMLNFQPEVGQSSECYVTRNAELFKKYVRVLCCTMPGMAISNNNLDDCKDLVISKIDSVKFEDFFGNKSTNPSGGSLGGTKVTITLDMGLNYNMLGEVFLAIAPASANETFYAGGAFVFGDFTKINRVIDGIHGWRLYDKIFPDQ